MRHLTILLSIIGLTATFAASASTPAIWFAPPLGTIVKHTGYIETPDYMELFQPGAPWKTAATKVSVFKVGLGWTLNVSNSDLRTLFDFLKQHNMSLAVEAGVLTPSDVGGQGVEGFKDKGVLLACARRIQANGGHLRYIAMDEPIFFSTVYSGPNACHASVIETVANATSNIKALWREFPDVQVGDIEPIVGVKSMKDDELADRYIDGIKAFRASLGRPLAFFHADVDWRSDDYLKDVTTIRKKVLAATIPFGIIYNGSNADTTDLAWIDATARHMATIEFALGQPADVIFQSWNSNPKKLLPEIDPSAMTSIIGRYFGTRTRLAVSASRHEVTGRLTSANNSPIASAPIQATIRYRTRTADLSTYTMHGIAPATATSAILAIRVNAESGVGEANLVVSTMRVQQAGASAVQRGFASQANLALWTGLPHAVDYASVQDGLLHIAAGPAQSLLLNSQPVSINPGQPYTFEVMAAVPSSAAGSGYFALVFLADSKELGRATIPFDAPTLQLALVNTDRDGRWRVAIPAQQDQTASGMRVDAQYSGNLFTWPAFASTGN
ncbi:MAG: hypothetical protein P4L33_03170 [Capsulimonadaceae bacterium]|nr:hypothetical protein [Capsulimonadaceae bacterium]